MRVARCFGGPLDGASYSVNEWQREIRVPVQDYRVFAQYAKRQDDTEAALAPSLLFGVYEFDRITHRWEWIPPGHRRPIV